MCPQEHPTWMEGCFFISHVMPLCPEVPVTSWGHFSLGVLSTALDPLAPFLAMTAPWIPPTLGHSLT